MKVTDDARVWLVAVLGMVFGLYLVARGLTEDGGRAFMLVFLGSACLTGAGIMVYGWFRHVWKK